MFQSFMRRLIAIGCTTSFFAVAVVLLWSDRAGALPDDLANFAVRAGRKAERASGINVLDRSDIPGQPDQIGHMMLWATGMVLIGWVMRHRVSLTLAAFGVAALSFGFEIAQPVLSSSRGISAGDVVANLVGVGIGAFVTAVLVRAEEFRHELA